MNNYFEGWYFKQETGPQNPAYACTSVAVIPSLHLDEQGRRQGMLQLVTPRAAWAVRYPGGDCLLDREAFCCRIGKNHFDRTGIRLWVRRDGLCAEGELRFGRFAAPRYDAMGPLSLLPLLQCRHSIFSLRHEVTGKLQINGESYRFESGAGYAEGDRGRDFPSRYFWTQSSFGQSGAVVLAVAAVPMLGRTFDGVLGMVLLQGRQYRFASYLGARVAAISNEGAVVVQQNLRLTVRVLSHTPLQLRAPSGRGGVMSRQIGQSLTARVAFRLEEKGRALLDFVSETAGLEAQWVKR